MPAYIAALPKPVNAIFVESDESAGNKLPKLGTCCLMLVEAYAAKSASFE